jgi:hypothetical protein
MQIKEARRGSQCLRGRCHSGWGCHSVALALICPFAGDLIECVPVRFLSLLFGDGNFTGSWDNCAMSSERSSLADWTPEQIAHGKLWVQAWKEAGAAMEQLRRDELRQLDGRRAIALLCGPADYRVPPRAPKPTSGLVEQQRWFMKAARRD